MKDMWEEWPCGKTRGGGGGSNKQTWSSLLFPACSSHHTLLQCYVMGWQPSQRFVCSMSLAPPRTAKRYKLPQSRAQTRVVLVTWVQHAATYRPWNLLISDTTSIVETKTVFSAHMSSQRVSLKDTVMQFKSRFRIPGGLPRAISHLPKPTRASVHSLSHGGPHPSFIIAHCCIN